AAHDVVADDFALVDLREGQQFAGLARFIAFPVGGGTGNIRDRGGVLAGGVGRFAFWLILACGAAGGEGQGGYHGDAPAHATLPFVFRELNRARARSKQKGAGLAPTPFEGTTASG